MLNKKRLSYTSLLFTTGLVLAGCATDLDEDPETPDDEVIAPGIDDEDEPANGVDDENSDDDAVSQDLETWFPKLENTFLEYEGEGIEYASFTRYPQFIHENTLQMVETTTGTHVVTVYEYTDDEIREIFVRPETYFRDDIMDTGLSSQNDQHEIILQLPIEVGNTWESPTGSTLEITDVDFEIETEFGTFEAIEVTRFMDDSEVVYYYADGIGLVEQISNPGDDEIEIRSTLISFFEDQPEEIPLTVFTLDDQAMGIDAVNHTIELYTNDPIRFELTEILRAEAPENETAALITESVEINSMFLGDDNIAHIDFSVELTEDMQAGAGIEGMILQAIANTIGGYYNVEEVLLTVDGEPYSSGHFEFEEGETIPVDHSEVSW